VPELQQAWEVAVAGEFVLVTDNRAGAARDVAELGQVADGTLPAGQDLAERVLVAWVRGAGVPLGFPGDACPHCLTALHELSLVDKPMELADLMAAVRAATDGPVPEHAVTATRFLTHFGALATGRRRALGSKASRPGPLGMTGLNSFPGSPTLLSRGWTRLLELRLVRPPGWRGNALSRGRR
jgi:hypothetical protein